MDAKFVGLTQAAGYQIGVRRTLPVSQQQAWDFLVSPEGLKLWLGDIDHVDLEPGAEYRCGDGTSGQMRVVKPLQQLRLTWQKPGWEKASTLQIRLLPIHEDRTTVAFHQEHLDGPQTRALMKVRMEEILAKMAEKF